MHGGARGAWGEGRGKQRWGREGLGIVTTLYSIFLHFQKNIPMSSTVNFSGQRPLMYKIELFTNVKVKL